MKLSREKLTEKLISAAEKFVSSDEAAYLADETIEAYLRKAPRTNPLKSTIDDLGATQKFSSNKIKYSVDLPSFVEINFEHQGPLTYLKRVHDLLAGRSAKNGLAMASFVNSQSMHTLHTWVQGLAKKGILAIAVCNGGPGAVVPFNGTKGLFGTNPIAYGIPGKSGEIFCVDMATSEIPYFEIMNANKNNETLKERAAVDSNGEFTTNAKAALDFSESETDPTSNIVPMGGGYKGYYIVYLMEVLTSALIGMPSSPEMSTDFVPEEHGAVLLAFSPKAMGTSEKFAQSIEALCGAIKDQKAKKGEKVLYPGEGNNEKFSKLSGAEIEVDEDLIKRLESLTK
ncbi:Ldh family oxidoreductase [Candidatus Saccharibacteria bacterium]|nr:Ldh family oxidoreductase [Candidatus Saccharibacteria bacterium]